MPKITIYSTPTCAFCQMAKEFFKEHNLVYTDINVAEDHAKAQEMVEKSGQLGVPVIVIEKDGKENIVIGFDRAELSSLLDAKS